MTMDGFKAFKYYMALKLHFTNPKFNVFDNKGHMKGSLQKFMSRNDSKLFEKLARQFDDREYIQYVASNFMYGNTDVVYNTSEAMNNYKEYLRRRQSITRVFENDLDTITKTHVKYDLGGLSPLDIIKLYLADKITLETMVILDNIEHIVSKLRQDASVSLLLDNQLTTIEKSHKFVKYDENKIDRTYKHFTGEMKVNG